MSLFQIFRRNVDFLPLFYNQNKILFITNRGTEINFKIFFPVDTYQIICNWFSYFNALAPLIFCNSIWKFKIKNYNKRSLMSLNWSSSATSNRTRTSSAKMMKLKCYRSYTNLWMIRNLENYRWNHQQSLQWNQRICSISIHTKLHLIFHSKKESKKFKYILNENIFKVIVKYLLPFYTNSRLFL